MAIPQKVIQAMIERSKLNQKKKELDEKYKRKCAEYDNVVSRYFQKRNVTSESFQATDGTGYKVLLVQLQKVTYDVEAIKKYIPDYVQELIISQCQITDMKAFAKIMKQYGVPYKAVKPLLNMQECVNEKQLNNLYEICAIPYEDIEKCATVENKASYLKYTMAVDDG